MGNLKENVSKIKSIKDKKHIGLLVLAAELAVLLLIVMILIYKSGHPYVIDVQNENLESDVMDYENGIWHIDADNGIDSDTDILTGPYCDIPKGMYLVTIEYDTDSDQICTLYDNRFNNATFISNTEPNRLPSYKNQESFHTIIKEDLNKFVVNIRYGGEGYLDIKSISISRDDSPVVWMLVCAILIMLLADILYLKREYIRVNRNVILAILGVTLLASLPLFDKGIAHGADYESNLVRIENFAYSIKLGDFPTKMNSIRIDGYGYPESVYYGDLTLLFPGLLRLMNVPVVVADKIYVFAVNLFGSIIAYACFYGIFKKKDIASILMLIYICSPYRLLILYEAANIGTYTSMIFLPIVALGFYRIFTAEEPTKEEIILNGTTLAIGMSLIISTHILMTEMSCIVMGIICVLLIKKTFKKPRLISLILAVCETVFLTMWFTIPFFDYMLTQSVDVQDRMHRVNLIQDDGASILRLFTFWAGPYYERYDGYVGNVAGSPGLLLMLAFIVGIILAINKMANARIKILMLVSSIVMFASSKLFPWNHLVKNYRIGRILSTMQFPARYIGILCVLLAILVGEIAELPKIKELFSVRLRFILVLASVAAIIVSYSYLDFAIRSNEQDTTNLSLRAACFEYLRSGADIINVDNDVHGNNIGNYELISHVGPEVVIDCKDAQKDAYVEAPLFNYKGYRAFDEAGNEYEITDGDNCLVRVLLPEGFSGIITVDYYDPWYWKASYAVSLISLAAIIILWNRNRRKIKTV